MNGEKETTAQELPPDYDALTMEECIERIVREILDKVPTGPEKKAVIYIDGDLLKDLRKRKDAIYFWMPEGAAHDGAMPILAQGKATLFGLEYVVEPMACEVRLISNELLTRDGLQDHIESQMKEGRQRFEERAFDENGFYVGLTPDE